MQYIAATPEFAPYWVLYQTLWSNCLLWSRRRPPPRSRPLAPIPAGRRARRWDRCLHRCHLRPQPAPSPLTAAAAGRCRLKASRWRPRRQAALGAPLQRRVLLFCHFPGPPLRFREHRPTPCVHADAIEHPRASAWNGKAAALSAADTDGAAICPRLRHWRTALLRRFDGTRHRLAPPVLCQSDLCAYKQFLIWPRSSGSLFSYDLFEFLRLSELVLRQRTPGRIPTPLLWPSLDG